VRRALAWSEAAGDDLGVGQAWNILAMDAAYRGDLVQARAHLDQSIAAFERVDYAYVKAQALRAQAQLCQVEGNQVEALALIRRALAVSQEIAADHLTYEMRSIEGEILLALGELDAALAAVSEAASHASPDIFQSYLLHHRHARGLLAVGRDADACAALAAAYAELSALLDGLTPEQRARSRTAIPAHRALLADASRLLGVQ
jgi:tetratricopeptide (TPR) repeat protein